MDQLSAEEIEMLFQAAEKESLTFSRLYKETLEKAKHHPPQPLKDYQSLYDQIDEIISTMCAVSHERQSSQILSTIGSLIRFTLTQQARSVKRDIDDSSSPEELEHAFTCLATMALMIGKQFVEHYEDDYLYVKPLCYLLEIIEELGTMLRDKGITIVDPLQGKIKELEVVFAHEEFDHIPTIFWAEARGERRIEKLLDKSEESTRFDFRRNFRRASVSESDSDGLTADEMLVQSLENMNCNPRKRLRSN
jgi:hypothetical protein